MFGGTSITSATVRSIAMLIGILASISVSACDSRESATSMIPVELKRLEGADPAADLAEALRMSDLRFLGLGGYSRDVVPGVPDFEERYKRFGMKMIPGTGDVYLNAQHERLQQVARNYAKRYNTLLLEYMRTKGIENLR
jgi:hypothetical protein